MKVIIKNYPNYIGPYQIAELLKFIGVSEEKYDKFGDWLSKTWINKFLEKINDKRKQKIKIRIDDFDVWSMDYTISLIILPMLKLLKDQKHGAPFTDDEDVPEGMNLKSTEAPPLEHEWDTDDNFFKRWDWIMDEIIWTFEQLTSENNNENRFYDRSECTEDSEDIHDWLKSKIKIDQEGLKKYNERINNGLRLFGKYFRSLWD